MARFAAVVVSLSFLACRGFASPLSVEVSDALWPQWLQLLHASPLPEGVQTARAQPDSSPSGDLAVLELGTEGKVVGFMPLVPVVSLGQEQSTVTLEQVSQGKIKTLPLSAVSLPDLAVPLDGLLPDQKGYPLFQKIVLRLKSSNTELLDWYTHIVEQTSPSTGRRAGIMWIEAVGDIMPARGVDKTLLSSGGLERVFTDTLPVLQGADLLLGNLESTSAEDGTPENKSYTFRFRGEAVKELKEAGFSYVCLANNHTFDFGERGFLQTLTAVSKAGILTSGAGRNLHEASSPAVFNAGDQEVRVLSFGAFPVERTGFDGRVSERVTDSRPGILWLDEQGLTAEDRGFQVPGAFNIAFVHGGQEWRTTPTPEQRNMYRELVAHGASLVLSAHPHVLQGMEAIGDSLIVYSLGNFLFPGMDGTPGGQDSVILKVGVYEGRIRYVQAIPVRLSDGTVSRARGDGALEDFLARTREIARGRN